MPNKREFKKYVDALGASVCEQMMAVYYNVDGVDKAAVEKAIAQVLGAVGAAKSHANIFFDKGPKAFEDRKQYEVEKDKFFKALFKKIANDFSNEIDGALKTFNQAVPASVKADNKAEAAAK